MMMLVGKHVLHLYDSRFIAAIGASAIRSCILFLFTLPLSMVLVAFTFLFVFLHLGEGLTVPILPYDIVIFPVLFLWA